MTPLQTALARYDTLTGGDVRNDQAVRPTVALELAYALSLDPLEAAALLADALATRSQTKELPQ
jgi:hypothetical protein